MDRRHVLDAARRAQSGQLVRDRVRIVRRGGVRPADGLVPPEALGLLGELVRVAEPGGEVESLPIDDTVRIIADLDVRDGRLLAATFGDGIYEHDGVAWQNIGPDPSPAYT